MKKINLPPITEINSHRYTSSLQTQAQRDEDVFMHVHGGLGSRAIYRAVEALSVCGDSQKRLISRIFRSFTKGNQRSRGIPAKHAFDSAEK